MIQILADKYRKHVAYPFFILFYLQIVIVPLHAAVHINGNLPTVSNAGNSVTTKRSNNNFLTDASNRPMRRSERGQLKTKENIVTGSPEKINIGGPSSPEAASFKAVGADNLVNLFTGDFSYSIPLLDVGGYPVNLFYSGGITMEQEASWVGLGWNINPGTVSRSMRGVPDDFNGDDKLIQTQNVKPNRTWGGEVGIDGEIIGIKKPNVNFSLGVSYNNYLGPALELGAGISVSIPLQENVKSEKSVASTDSSGIGGGSLGLSAKLNSRSGLTFSPSLNINLPISDKKANIGAGLSTSYNSRTGIKDINLNMQASSSRFQKDSKGSYDKNNSVSLSAGIGSSSISFARPSYMPTLRMPMEYANYSGQIEFGGGMFGLRGAAHAQGYYSESKVPEELRVVYKPLVGFIYSDKAAGNKDAVMDFNRLNDGEVTPNTPVLSAPQYAYDVFSIQGEGTGGTIRAYRGDLGFMRDNETVSKDKNISIGFDIAPPGHYGGNWNIVHTPTRVGGWEDGNNTLKQTLSFQPQQASSSIEPTDFENVYFRNPGEATVSNPNLINRIGGDNLVRFKISGSKVNPRLESVLEQFNKKTLTTKAELPVNSAEITGRDKRTQITTMLTAKEAMAVGLEKVIRNYSGEFNNDNIILCDSIKRYEPGSYRKQHHISEINVLEQSGMRYVYGIPVYSIKQKDFTFSVNNIGDPVTGIVNFSSDEPTIGSRHMANSSRLDGYVMAQETPAYASSFLLTGLLSPDYVDVTGDGITEDDLGGAVKFDYKKSDSIHRWRTPRNKNTAATAHFNEGTKTEKKDNKATISYGEREVWYLSAVESKSMVAIFKTGARDDAKGVKSDMDGGINENENANRKLDRIDLYTKSEIKTKGITNARPLKTVHFEYGYSLCIGTPDSKIDSGKLTLKSVYFTYNGRARTSKDKYVFNYGDASSDNPGYANNASDKWVTYKNPDTNVGSNVAANPGGLPNAEFPYTSGNKQQNDIYAGAWSLKKILLPSGGQMEVKYEADDYAYVQDRRACNMFNIYGFGNGTDASTNDGIYNNGFLGLSQTDNYYVYVELSEPLENTDPEKQRHEIFSKYLQSLNQLAFKLQINMPKGPEALTIYANYDDYGACTNNSARKIIYLKLRPVDGKSPLSKTAIGFITENLPGQAFDGYEIEVGGVAAFLEMAGGLMTNLKNAFKSVDLQIRSAGKARTVVLNKSFVRLTNPAQIKYGGGVRVKRVVVKDNWARMKGKYTSTYGQDYDYTTTETVDGKETVISSGVASYEPGLGSEENPFREILSYSNKMPLASAQYGAIEMPMLDGLYPAAGVGYSKITVRSIHRKGTHGDTAVRSGIGKQVTEFYTAKDFPVYSSFTPISSIDYHFNSFFSLLYKEIKDRKVLSQGFLVETNDMHGKMKSQIAYSESDEKTPLSYSYHTYKNTGKNGLNDRVDFVNNELGGAVTSGNMGIDMELMTDVREFKVQTNGFSGQIQLDFFNFVPFPLFMIPMLPIKTYTENKYRAVTCTKLINYHAIEDSVIVMDKGSVISTKTIAYDAETGTPIVSKTANEFNDPIYTVNYPAYWAYSGMAPAYKNIDRQFSGINFSDGKILNFTNQDDVFESGDELYITSTGAGTPDCHTQSDDVPRLWAYDSSKNITALTVEDKNLIFIDSSGRPFTKAGVGFRVLKSGKRNLLGNSVASVTLMNNPVVDGKLDVNEAGKVLATSAMEFNEKWQTDYDIIKRYELKFNPATCIFYEEENCNGYLEKKVNPYTRGLMGNYKNHRGLVFYGERMEQSVSSGSTNIRSNGYLKDYANYWNFDTDHNLVPDSANTKWVWNNEVTKFNGKGLELENKNALGVYTSAQYGYNKTIPQAIANNSRLYEMFTEGFEDGEYDEFINKKPLICRKTQGGIAELVSQQIVSTESLGFFAHTGKKVLKSINNSDLTFSINSDTSKIYDSYNLLNLKDAQKVLINEGGNFDTLYTLNMGTVSINPPYFTKTSGNNSNFGMEHSQELKKPGNGSPREYKYKTFQYFNVTTDGIYEVTSNFHGEFDCSTSSFESYKSNWNIYNVENEQIIPRTQISNSGDTGISYFQNTAKHRVCLKKGIYRLDCVFGAKPVYGASEDCKEGCTVGYNVHLNANFTTYKDLSSTTVCPFTKPIPATDSMLNPTFSLLPGKKMFFSGWVKESCSSIPCSTLNYTHSKVQLNFGGGQIKTFTPSGSIIDGWQKVEGDFTVPANASNVTFHLINTGSVTSYWDDLRIHPFNANMKSYSYDPDNLKLSAELDENNYATFYEYDEEGQLVRVKKETSQGIKTINEKRSAKQKAITGFE